jgi:hypothetical protein
MAKLSKAPSNTGRAKETAKRRAAGNCICCGDIAGKRAVWHAETQLYKFVQRATCIGCGVRANERRNRRKASAAAGDGDYGDREEAGLAARDLRLKIELAVAARSRVIKDKARLQT